jgi:uncharacterized protein with FMN-binding domain
VKRALLSIAGTVVGLVALLDFKSHQRPIGVAVGAVPPTSPQPTSTPSTRHRATSGRTPKAARRSTSPSQGVSGRFVGSAVQTQYGVVQVAVTVAGGKITKVTFPQLTAYDQQSAYINGQAAPILVQETMSAQSARIDTVSGASYTSAGYLQSLQSALDRAGLK